MNSLKTLLRKILPHAAIILGGMYVVFYVIDTMNTAMGFVNNRITKTLLLAFGIVGMVNACVIISDDRKKARRAAEKARKKKKRV